MPQSAVVDLTVLGTTIAANLILGFIIFFRNQQGATNRLFLLLVLSITIWGITNYFSYTIVQKVTTLLLARLVLFFSIPFATFFFLLVYTFPDKELKISKKYLAFLVALSLITMVVTLLPITFKRIIISSNRSINAPEVGFGIVLFAFTVLFYDLGGLALLLKRITKARGLERTQLSYLCGGFILMLGSILIFTFILPSFVGNIKFLPLAAVFTLPFVASTFYAILKHRLLNVRVIATEILAFLVIIIAFFEIIFSQSIWEIIFRTSIFVALLIFGILLIRSVLREVEQREKLEQLTQELSAANQRLKELDQLKTEFLSFASHQVKSPMAAVKGFATLIFDGTYGEVPEKVKAGARKIKEAADRLIALVNNLLDLRRLEEGRMEYTFAEVSINKLVQSVVEEHRPLADNKKLALEFTADATDLRVMADEQKLRQVIQNVIDNSIKYTEQGFVKVAVKQQDNAVLVSVVDSGIGIAPELLPQMFQRFIRDPAVKVKIQGTGLGLFIAKEMIVAHKGEIWAESEGLGKGSRFFVKLPSLKENA